MRYLLPDSTRASMRLAAGLVTLCGMTLAFDLGGELVMASQYPGSLSALVWLHLLLELLASLGLGWAFVLIRREGRKLSRAQAESSARLTALYGAFDADLIRHFDLWGLSAAERDVALLVVRGLGIAEIAQARGTREGTTKAQVHAVLRKSGAASRAELVASFLDGLLHHGAEGSR